MRRPVADYRDWRRLPGGIRMWALSLLSACASQVGGGSAAEPGSDTSDSPLADAASIPDVAEATNDGVDGSKTDLDGAAELPESLDSRADDSSEPHDAPFAEDGDGAPSDTSDVVADTEDAVDGESDGSDSSDVLPGCSADSTKSVQAPTFRMVRPGHFIPDGLLHDLNSDGLTDVLTAPACWLQSSGPQGASFVSEVELEPCGSTNDELHMFDINGMHGFVGVDSNVMNVNVPLQVDMYTGWYSVFDPFSWQYFQVRIGDVTGDGIPDIVAWDNTNVKIVEVLADGSLNLVLGNSLGNHPNFKMSGLVITDLTGDGLADALEHDLYVNQGNLTFTKASFLPLLPDKEYLPELKWRDLEADGVPELMTYRRSTDEILIAIPGTGGALPTYEFIPNPFPGWCVSYVGDLNQDSRLDRILTADMGIRIDYGEAATGWTTIYESDDARGFDTGVMVLDLEGEGRLDVIVTDQGPYPEVLSQPLSVVFMHQADGSWRSLRPASSQRTRREEDPALPTSTGAALLGGESQKLAHDLNKDGCDDLVLFYHGQLSTVLSRCDGTFDRPRVSGDILSGRSWVENITGSLELVDVNADGFEDAVVRWSAEDAFCVTDSYLGGGGSGVVLATPDGLFGQKVEFPVPIRGGFALSDVDDNGRLDVITPVFLSDEGYPAPGASCEEHESPYQVSSAVYCCAVLSGEVQVILQSTTGEWTALPPVDVVGTETCGLPPAWDSPSGSGVVGEHGSSRYLPAVIASADMTGDGHKDLVIGADRVRASLETIDYYEEPGFYWSVLAPYYQMLDDGAFVLMPGDGTGHFGPIVNVREKGQVRFSKARLEDWDQDGDDDVLMTSGGNVHLVVNTQVPPPEKPVCSVWSTVPTMEVLDLDYTGLLTPADWNGDACQDYLSPYVSAWSPEAPGIWLGNDESPVLGVSPDIEGSWGRPCAGDFNGDGMDDLAITMSNGYISVLLNTPSEKVEP